MDTDVFTGRGSLNWIKLMEISIKDRTTAVLKTTILMVTITNLGFGRNMTTTLALKLLARISEYEPDALDEEKMTQELEFLITEMNRG